jgi:hypothetical protein
MGLLGISGAGSPRSTLRQGLVAAYNMSNSGNLGLDSAGSSNLTNVNAATQAVGKVNNAAQFVRASNQNLTLPDNAALSMGDIDFTLAAWVYLDSKPTQAGIVSKSSGSNAATTEYYLDYLASSDRFRFVVSDGTTAKVLSATNFGAPALSTWYLILAYHDSVANQIGMQVSNTALNTTAHSAGVQDSSGAFEIGREFASNSFGFDGRIGPVLVWKRMLRTVERYALWNNGNGLNV